MNDERRTCSLVARHPKFYGQYKFTGVKPGERMKSRSYHFAILVIALMLVTMSASQVSFGADNAPVAVKIDNFSFSPQTVTVAVGTEVTWTNQDDIPHTVVSDDKTTFK